jgi:hypothetical protein
LMVPLTAELATPAPPVVELELEEPLLLSEPQAASARVPTRATAPMRADRGSFKVVSFTAVTVGTRREALAGE